MSSNDKDYEQKTCCDCGAIIFITHGHVRKMPLDHKWRCKSCMSKYRSNLMRNSSTSIGKIIQQKLDDPTSAAEYRKTLSERATKQWTDKSEEEKRVWIDKFTKGNAEYRKTIPKEVFIERGKRLAVSNANMTDERKLLRNQRISSSRKKYMYGRSEEERERDRENGRLHWESMTDEQKKAYSERTIQQWKNMSEDERAARISELVGRSAQRWKDATPEYREKFSNTIKRTKAKISIDERERNRQRHIRRWRDYSPEKKEELLRKSMLKSRSSNTLNKQFERSFASSSASDYFYFQPENLTERDGIQHHWDYGIYSKNGNELAMVVDLDGGFYHADTCDYDGLHSHEEYDSERIMSVPDGVKWYIIYEKSYTESFKDFLKNLLSAYDEFILSRFEMCRGMLFPTPKYRDLDLIRSWNSIVSMNCNDKYHQNLSLNTRVGDRLITHFHPSIYHAHRRGNVSPYDAWYDDNLLMKCIENRVIYQNHLNPNKILQGFNISKIAPKVSVFSAGRAKMIIDRYLSGYDIVFDPFSGFSGRMLGTVSLGKKYIGQDISETHVRESNELIEFLDKSGIDIDATVTRADALLSNGEYPCLFACPPYEDKEQWIDVEPSKRTCDDWIDICLNNFKCSKYVFVVDYTEKYIENVSIELLNKGHIGNNTESIVIIDKKG